jgi:aryl-alcohol dehydrogenase-like predicted oxidoreductase
MGMSAFYGSHETITDEDNVNLIGEALNQGVNFFDTAQIYGFGKNERLLAQV